MLQTVCDLLVTRLIDWGVNAIFGLPGDGVNGIFEALRTRQEKIRFIQVVMKRPPRLPRVLTPSTPVDSGFVSLQHRRRDRVSRSANHQHRR